MGQRGRPRHPDVLTPREQDVLALIRDGLTNEQITEHLNIGFETAKSHVAEILSKLGVASREEAAAWQPEAERAQRWSFGRIVLALAGIGVIAAAVAGLALLTWGLSRSGTSEDVSTTPSGSSSPSPSAATRTPSPAALSYFPTDFVQFGRQMDQALANQDTGFFTDNVVFGQWDCGGSPPPGPGPYCLPSTSGSGSGILLGLWNSEGDILSPATYSDYIAGILSNVKTGTSDAYGATPRILAAADLSDNIEGENTADTYEFVVTAISSDPNANVGPAVVPPGADPSRIALVFFASPVGSAWKIIRIDRAVRSLIDPYSPSGTHDGADLAVKAWLRWIEVSPTP